MRYKTGYKVVISSNLKSHAWPLSAREQIGKTRTVRVIEKERYRFEECQWSWDDSEIDHEATAKLTLPQPSKDMLRSGMKVVYRDETFAYALVEILKFISDAGKTDSSFSKLHKDLTHMNGTHYDIMQIWDGDTLIAQRTEKSEAELKKESLEKQMADLQQKVDEIAKEIKSL